MGLDLSDKRVLVAGAGAVGSRRALALLERGAAVTVIAPDASPEIRAAASRATLEWHARMVSPGDLDGAWFVVAATGSAEVNRQVADWAEAACVWCVEASDSTRGTARTPATSLHGDLAIGVLSLGAPDPRRAAAVRDDLARALDDGSADLRRHRPAGGRVILVGSGPGAPDLMTVRARHALAEANVVVADRLGATDALRDLPDDVEVIDVGKAPGSHTATQSQINALLIELAGQGKTVVRLKGGDPFIFGRGGEELAACIAAGIPCEVIPGVTSAFSVPALAGIPVTHRGTARAVLVATGSDGPDALIVDAITSGATVVILMGVAHLTAIVDAAVADGADGALPVAIIERGSTPDERITRTTLATATHDAAVVGVVSPAVIVVGAVAAPGLLSP